MCAYLCVGVCICTHRVLGRASIEGMKVAKMSLSLVHGARLVNFSPRVGALFAREKGVYCPQLEMRTIVSPGCVIYASVQES